MGVGIPAEHYGTWGVGIPAVHYGTWGGIPAVHYGTWEGVLLQCIVGQSVTIIITRRHLHGDIYTDTLGLAKRCGTPQCGMPDGNMLLGTVVFPWGRFTLLSVKLYLFYAVMKVPSSDKHRYMWYIVRYCSCLTRQIYTFICDFVHVFICFIQSGKYQSATINK